MWLEDVEDVAMFIVAVNERQAEPVMNFAQLVSAVDIIAVVIIFRIFYVRQAVEDLSRARSTWTMLR